MFRPQLWVVVLSMLLFHLSPNASADLGTLDDITVKSSVYLSPPFFLRPGSVIDKYYFGIPFPKGHIALKSFDAEVVEENGSPIPLHETYLHHWFIEPYYGPKEDAVPRQFNAGEIDLSKIIMKRNDGVCKGTLTQYYGLGSETRRTSTWVPGTYGIEIGKSEDFPNGYEEKWMLNVHAIDTRGAEDRLGCTECKCSLYNVTTDNEGHPLAKDYIGGLYCCNDGTQCQVKQGFNGVGRKLYLRYTVRWAVWDESIAPVKIYIFDVTDTKRLINDSADGNVPTCKVEYKVKPCSTEGIRNDECVDVKKTEVALPHGGDIVYGVAHQHTGGLGAALYRQDGRLLCTSTPTYGEGKEAGNEAGYIVGMSSCYPEPGSIRVADGEILTVISNYSSSRQHTGVMGLFYVLVAEPQTTQEIMSRRIFSLQGKELPKYPWMFVVMGGLVAVMVGVFYRRRKEKEGYQSLVTA